ncbi:MAG: hypothetical protein AB8H79_00165 [Myxococcota bacterium]
MTHLAGQSVGRGSGAIEGVKGMLSNATREADVRIMRLDQQGGLTVMVQD